MAAEAARIDVRRVAELTAREEAADHGGIAGNAVRCAAPTAFAAM
jgi:hypothetical protein